MFKRFFIFAGAAFAGPLLGAWAGLAIVLDNVSRVDFLRTMGNPDSIPTKALTWLFATPWPVPALLASIAVLALIHFMHRMTLVPTQKPVKLQEQKSISLLQQPICSITAWGDHELNVEDLAAQAKVAAINSKLSVLEYFHRLLERDGIYISV